MRHRKQKKNLSRTSSHNKAMFANLAISTIKHEIIKTTVAKAKRLRSILEPIITIGKTDSVANRRRVFAKLGNKEAVGLVFKELGPRFADRPGGYLRIIKCGFRAGDGAPMAYVELVERSLPSEE